MDEYPISFLPYEYTKFLEVSQLQDSIQARELYWDWISDFCRKNRNFLTHQKIRFQIINETRFKQLNNVSDEDFSDLYIYEKWIKWCDRNNFSRYMQDVEYELERISQWRINVSHNLRLASARQEVVQSVAITNVGAITEYVLQKKDLSFYQMNELWFNWIYKDVTDKNVFDYGDYLRTERWKKIRYTLLMLKNHQCHSSACYALGDRWDGAEWDLLHVHHLSYTNLGHEKYRDLTLLCERCHFDLHNGGTIQIVQEN